MDDQDELLKRTMATVPAGRWAVGVSGGADSVALLHLLCERKDLTLHVAHLDHELRGEASRADAAMVAGLARTLRLGVTIARRSEIEPGLGQLPVNPSARYRAGRYALFARVVAEEKLLGVMVAHHADDQAETVMLRLLRGAGASGVVGMRERGKVGAVEVVRPLLGVSRATLRRYLEGRGVAWREDASNQSSDYARNVVRAALEGAGALAAGLIELGRACAGWREWLEGVAPELGKSFNVRELADLSGPVARAAARRWLVGRGCPAEEVSEEVAGRLVEMASDAATSGRRHFPGAVLVERKRGIIAPASSPPSSSQGT